MVNSTIRKLKSLFDRQNRVKTILVGLFFVIILVIGLKLFPDYGVSTDEPIAHKRAYITTKYVTELFGLHVLPDSYPQLADYKNRDHGVIFDLVALAFQILFRFQDSQQIYYMKHLLTYFVFLAGVFSIYQIAQRRFNSWRYGLIAAVFLYLSPRIFADAFYNPKDLVFMSAYLVAMNTALWFLVRPSIKRAVVHALATAIAVDVRVMGILIILSTLALFIFKLIDRRIQPSLAIKTLATYLVASGFLIVLFWPMLWSNPIKNFLDAFFGLARFARHETEVLLMGQTYMSTQVPWFYTPAWMAVTTPILYSALFITGFFFMCKHLIVDQRLVFWKNDNDLQDIFFLALFFGPMLAVIILNSVLYDGWRQMYFIYPAFILIAVYGLQKLLSLSYVKSKQIGQIVKAALVIVMALSLTQTAIWMVKAHPLQNVYFNALAGSNWKANYELDYWGLANRGGLEYILQQDPSPVISVTTNSVNYVDQSFNIIDPADRDRLLFEYYDEIQLDRYTDQHPLYVFNNYKRLKDPEILDRDKNYELFYEKKVDGETILRVYKLITPATVNP